MTQPSEHSAPRHDESGAGDGYDPEIVPAEDFGDDVTASGSITTQDPYRADFDADPHRGDAGGSGKADAAKGQAGAMKDSAKQSGEKVAGTAKEQASQVKGEAGHHAKELLKSGKSEASNQLGAQQKRLAGGLQSVADEFGSMADNSEKSGPVTDLARQAAEKGGQLAQRLEHSEPSELLEEVKNFARRRPVAFLGIAAVTGLVVGRLTRGMTADAKSSDEGSANHGSSFDDGSRFRDDTQAGGSHSQPGYPESGYPESTYPQSGTGDVL